MEMSKTQPINCKKNCKQTGYAVSRLQRALLLKVGCLERKGGIAIRKDFNELSQRKFYYNVDILTERGYLESVAKNSKQLITTDKGKQYIQSICGDLQNNNGYVTPFMDRSHDIIITQSIIQKGEVPEGFAVSEKSNKLNWKSPQLIKHDEKNNLTVRITPGTIVYSFRQCYSVDAHHAVMVRLNITFAYAKMLKEYGWKIDLPKTAIIGQHHAISNKYLAEFTRRYNISYKSDRITFDSSINPNEFELINSVYAEDDFVRLATLFEDVMRDILKPAILLEMQEKYLESKKGGKAV